MDPLERLEIYIPVEAEVRSIPLWSLPKSVLRRMGFPRADTDGSMKHSDSPEGIWICPAVLRTKGQKAASTVGQNTLENSMSLMSKEFGAAPGPFRMSFVSSSHAAYNVLKDLNNALTGSMVSALPSHTPLSPPCSTPQNYRDSVVIYHGRIYLSIRKPGRSQKRPQLAPLSPIPSTSELSSKGQKRQSTQASLEPADREPPKRLHIPLPPVSSKQPKYYLKKSDHSTKDQELLNDNSPKKKHTTRKVTHCKTGEEVKYKGRDGAPSKTACSVPHSTDSVHSLYHNDDAKGENAKEEAEGSKDAWFQPLEEWQVSKTEAKILDQGNENIASTNENSEMGGQKKIVSGEPDNIYGVIEQSSNLSWTRREFQGAACPSVSLQQKVDFGALAQEEKIAQMKAKLKQREAALNSLYSS